MSRSFSLYLDFIRFSAAMFVFLYHSGNFHKFENIFFKMGHEAVVIFFVMSGFIIAFCQDTKEKTLKTYFINRASRIYSVAIPAVVLTFGLDMVGSYISPEAYGDHFDYPAIRFFSSLLFTNELWTVSIQSFSNVPFWSINYEVWYYVMFAALFYANKHAFPLLIFICLIAGPKILMLAPCWWIGVWIYKKNPCQYLDFKTNVVIFIASIVFYLMFIKMGMSYIGWDLFDEWVGSDIFREFAFSIYFITDYLLTVIVCANFSSARIIFSQLNYTENSITKAIRYLANLTFALYLLHQPLLNFFNVFFESYQLTEQLNYYVIVTCTLVLVLIIGHPIEKTKHIYRRFFNKVANKIEEVGHVRP